MSQLFPVDTKARCSDNIRNLEWQARCQIPQRSKLTASKPRTSASFVQRRPKSANRAKEDSCVSSPRSSPPVSHVSANVKKPSTIPRRVTKIISKDTSLIPVPTQGILKKREETNIENDEQKLQIIDLKEPEAVNYHRETVTELKVGWEEKSEEFERMKNDLSTKQHAIMELYASMRSTHKRLVALGQSTVLPPTDELRVMNVARLSPERLLQLCAEASTPQYSLEKYTDESLKTSFSMDIMKLYNIPMNLVAACEQTLQKRKEITEWLDSIVRGDSKDVEMGDMLVKINEFNSENEELNRTLEHVKEEFFREIQEITDSVRKSINEAITLRVRMEELAQELSELNGQNVTLRKQLYSVDHNKSHHSKSKMEEMERELKEERSRKLMIRDRLARADGMVKVEVERAAQLATTLEQVRSQNYNLERTIQQLRDQNQNIQMDFNKDLKKLKMSIRDNTTNFEEMSKSRDLIQAEKEELEKKIDELNDEHNKLTDSMEINMNNTAAKLEEIKKKYHKQIEEKAVLEKKIQLMGTQLFEAKVNNNNLIDELNQKKNDDRISIDKLSKELTAVKQDLKECTEEIETYRNKLEQKSDTVKDMELQIKEAIESQNYLKDELLKKRNYIQELESKNTILKQELDLNQSKMDSYEEQMTTIKTQLAGLQKEFGEIGEFEDLGTLRETISQQRSKLLESIKQNEDLTLELRNKTTELQHQTDNMSMQTCILEQNEVAIKMLSEKADKQESIIKFLRNNLELRDQVDGDFNRQLSDKNNEIQTLIENLRTRKEQVRQLENIIRTLEEQSRKLDLQRRNDREKITILERKIAELQTLQAEAKHADIPVDLDNLIKILENELESTHDPRIMDSETTQFVKTTRKYSGDRNKRDKLENFECHESDNNSLMCQLENHEKYPTKIVMGNFVKKTFLNSSNEDQFKGDKLDRKKAITNIDTQEWLPKTVHSPNVLKPYQHQLKEKNKGVYKEMALANENDQKYLHQNLFLINSDHIRHDKKFKMFKSTDMSL